MEQTIMHNSEESVNRRGKGARARSSLEIKVRGLDGSYRLLNKNSIACKRAFKVKFNGRNQSSGISLCLSRLTSDLGYAGSDMNSSKRMLSYPEALQSKQTPASDTEHSRFINFNCPTMQTATTTAPTTTFPAVSTYLYTSSNNYSNNLYHGDDDDDDDDDGDDDDDDDDDDHYYYSETKHQDAYYGINRKKSQMQIDSIEPPQETRIEKNYFTKRQERFTNFHCIAKFLILCHLINFNSWLVTYNNNLPNARVNFFAMANEVGGGRADDTLAQTQINPLDRILSQDFLLQSDSGEKLPDRTPLDFIKHTHHSYHHHHHQKHLHHHHQGDQQARQNAYTKNNDNNNDESKQNARHHHHRTSEKQQRGRRHNHHSDYYNAADRPLVRTKKGLVRGITQKLFTGKFVDAFLGIPFAQPPNGTYRFKHPQPNQPWSGELDASRLSSSCYQVNDTFFGPTFLGTSIWNANTPLSEDCLYLNIWTPFAAANMTVSSDSENGASNTASTSSSSSSSGYRSTGGTFTKRPVLVWIFGGGFYSGTSSLAIYEGGVLASEEDIIVVSMNYRVSALGFLYFARPDAPGNAGMFDQLLALQWVNDNIDQFGGDPNRVTIFGESAGAVSVALHLLSPLSRNLFSQAILQSGAATCPWGYKDAREIIANGLQLASLVNCPSTANELDAVVACLQRADPMALVSQEVGQTKTILNFPFVPVVDGSFLLEPPTESLIKSNFKHTRILLGSNNDEGNAWLIYLPEFSHCPTGSSGGGGGGPDLPRAPQQEQPKRLGASDELLLNSGLGDTGDPSNQLIESSDQAHRDNPLESLDLISASGHHRNQQQQQLQQTSSHEQKSNKLSEDQQNDNEAQHNDSKPCKPNDYPSFTREDFLRTLREDLNPNAEHPIGKEAIVFEYTNWNNPLDLVSNYDALDKIVGDYYFTCHVNEFAHRYALAGNSVYMYYFKQRSSMSPWPKWMGVLHADEINFVFGEPLNQMHNYTAKEVDLSRRMMKYWANFAKFGNPTKVGDNISMAEKWPEYKDKRQYFELHGDSARIGRGPRAKQCAFWSHHLPKLIDSFDRNQCLATHPDKLHIPPTEQGNNQVLIKLPSAFIISLSVILVLTITCLLIFAHRKWKWPSWNLSSSSNSAGRSD